MGSMKKWVIIICATGAVIVSGAFIKMQYNKENKPLPVAVDKGFAVIELFTSEGCSSCPPADELVARVQKENPLQQIYILAYHVDYWDRLGWKDSFSDPAYSKRQSKYADWLKLESVYTPQIVMNGKTAFVGSKEAILTKAITAGLHDTPVGTLTIDSRIVNGQVDIHYQTNAPLKNSDIVVALIQKSGQNKIKAGENSGRTLNHIQIVRKLLSEPLRVNTGNVNLALPEDHKDNKWEVIGFVQNNMSGEILSATKSALVIPDL